MSTSLMIQALLLGASMAQVYSPVKLGNATSPKEYGQALQNKKSNHKKKK